MENIKKYFDYKKLFNIFIGVLIQTIAIKYFFIPVGLFTTGITGIAIIISDFVTIIDYSIWYFILNIPLIILGFLKIGKRFTFFTLIAVVLFTIITQLLPDNVEVISDEELLMSIFGGMTLGFGISLTFKAGGSTGGLDIVAIYLSERFGKPTGFYAFQMNALIVLVISISYGLEKALFTLVALFITTSIIDRVHRRYKRVTLTVITKDPQDIIDDIQSNSQRGITVMKAKGAYSGAEKSVLYIVALSYEYMDIVEKIRRIDDTAFINVANSVGVFGNFITPKIDES